MLLRFERCEAHICQRQSKAAPSSIVQNSLAAPSAGHSAVSTRIGVRTRDPPRKRLSRMRIGAVPTLVLTTTILLRIENSKVNTALTSSGDKNRPRTRRTQASQLFGQPRTRHRASPQEPAARRHTESAEHVLSRASTASAARVAAGAIEWCGDSPGGAAGRRRGSAPRGRRRRRTGGRSAGSPGRGRTSPCGCRSGRRGRVAAEEGRAAVAAEPLLAAVLGLPHAQPVLARDDPERARRRVRVRRRRRAAAALAAPAVAVARDDERRGHLVADGAAVAAAREREIGHRHIITRTRTSAAWVVAEDDLCPRPALGARRWAAAARHHRSAAVSSPRDVHLVVGHQAVDDPAARSPEPLACASVRGWRRSDLFESPGGFSVHAGTRCELRLVRSSAGLRSVLFGGEGGGCRGRRHTHTGGGKRRARARGPLGISMVTSSSGSQISTHRFGRVPLRSVQTDPGSVGGALGQLADACANRRHCFCPIQEFVVHFVSSVVVSLDGVVCLGPWPGPSANPVPGLAAGISGRPGPVGGGAHFSRGLSRRLQ